MYFNKQTIEKLSKSYDKFTKKRQILMDNARTTIILSKKLIYAIHKNEKKSSSDLYKKLKTSFLKLKDSIKKTKALEYEPMYSAAMQEYCEAVCFYNYVKFKKIPKIEELEISADDYLMGVCDLTGELARRAVHMAIKKRFDEIKDIYTLVDEIYGFMLGFNLRNSELRKKSDSVKWNLKKIEELVYEYSKKLSLKEGQK